MKDGIEGVAVEVKQEALRAMSLLKSSAVIGGLTMGSRLLGFVRDMLIANTLGASWQSDAFFVAFKLPNFFRRLFAEGAFNAAFVPQFTRILTGQGEEASKKFAGQILSLLVLALLALNAVFIALMPFILGWFAPGFTDVAEQYDLAVELARICFPYILFISLVSLLAGILNAHKRFAVAAAAPVFLNLALIGALTFGLKFTSSAAHALSWGVFAAGVLQLIWLVAFAIRYRMMPPLRAPRLNDATRRFFKLLAPAALGAGVVQVNLLIDVVLASFYDDAVSYLYYADRLNELPIGVIGVAVGTVLLPMLAKYYKLADYKAAQHSLNRGIELVLLFALPSMAAFLVIPQLLIETLYEHGAFDAVDTRATTLALMAYAVGLPAFLLIKVLLPGFYANEDTKTPFKIALLCVGSNFVLNLILMQFWQHVGLALATSISGWLNAIVMAVILHRRGLLKADEALLRRLPRFVFASLLMCAALWAAPSLLGLQEASLLTALIVIGACVYVVSVLASGALRPSELRSYLRKQQ